MAYIQRVLEGTVGGYLEGFPVIGLTGPRQSGKSTMIAHLLGDRYEYLSLDDHEVVMSFRADPKKFMRLHDRNVVFDEVQNVPELFKYIKLVVDKERNINGRFVVTGSSQFAVMKRITESLAGRIGLLTLLPFQFSEMPASARQESLFRGSYPQLVTQEYKFFNDWYSAYINTYLNRDVRDLLNVGDMRDFRRCLQLLAARTAQILNMSELARDLAISVSTVRRWISVLEASYIIFLLPPYFSNLSKRIIKAPKVFFYDTGLVSYLTGIDSKETYEKGPMYGNLFENYVVSEIVKRETHAKTHTDFYYYRTSHGVEVDLIVDHRSWKELIEVKSSETFRPQMTSSIEKLMKKGDKGYLLYKGSTLRYTDDVAILNYKEHLK